MTPAGARELQWEVDGLRIAGLAWGDSASPPLLALHGWLDNAASFAMLAPELARDFYIVALDLTGHGRSSWRSADATYHVYDDLPQLLAVVEQLGWRRFELLGHSRGAIVSSLFAASFPECVAHLVLLDGISPPPLDEDSFVAQMRAFVLERKRLVHRHYRALDSEAAAVTVREEQGLTRQAAELIARRNLQPAGDGVSWCMDPRLRGASAMKMTAGQVDAVLAALTMPTLLLAAENGLMASRRGKFDDFSGRMPGLLFETAPGNHHFHMEEGVATLGARIRRFLLDRG